MILTEELNKEIPVAIAFRDDERIFGQEALLFGLRHPKLCFTYLLDLIGKTMKNPIVQLFQERFPYYDIIDNSARNGILFRHDK